MTGGGGLLPGEDSPRPAVWYRCNNDHRFQSSTPPTVCLAKGLVKSGHRSVPACNATRFEEDPSQDPASLP